VALGFDLHDRVGFAFFPADARDRPLTDVGLTAGDVVTLTTPAAEVHLELGACHG
jgi:hypothetical protein